MSAEANHMPTPKLWSQPLELALVTILVGIVGVTVVQVLFRYVLHLSLAWSEELARYLFLWLAALASAYAFKTRSHFAIRLVVDRLGARARTWVETFVVFIVAGFLALFVWKALEFSIGMAGEIAPSTKISMAIPYSSAWVGGLLMLFYVLRNWWCDAGDRRADRRQRPEAEV